MRKSLCFHVVVFGRYYAVLSMRMYDTFEVVGCSVCCVMLHIPLTNVTRFYLQNFSSINTPVGNPNLIT
jgi:TRAP-type C4-dicarboxylate transport system permease small subunit